MSFMPSWTSAGFWLGSVTIPKPIFPFYFPRLAEEGASPRFGGGEISASFNKEAKLAGMHPFSLADALPFPSGWWPLPLRRR